MNMHLKTHIKSLSRRTFMQGAVATGLAAPMIARLSGPALASGRQLNIALYGGAFSDAFRACWADPFEKETGIKVNTGTGASTALAKAQTLNPAGAEWDIVDLTKSGYITAMAQDLLLPIDTQMVDTSKLMPEYVKSHGYCYATYVWVRGWNSDLVKEGPQSWAEFWDTDRYKGKRILEAVNNSGVSLEAAIMSSGVKPKDLYPLDLDVAFSQLEKLGRDDIIWGASLQEPVQRIGSGETPLGGIYTGRAIMANRNGAKIGFSTREGIIDGDMLPIMKNARNVEEAQMLLNFIATRGDLAAQFTAMTSYGVPYDGIEKLLPADTDPAVLASLPSDPGLRETGLVSNDAYWADNMEAASMRFKTWQLG